MPVSLKLRTLSTRFNSHLKRVWNVPGSSGYTMIELLVVATIIVALAGLGIVSYQRTARTSRDNRRESDVKLLKVAMEFYYETYKNYPTANSVSALMSNGNFRQFVQRDSMIDPLNRAPYQYTVSSNSTGYQLCYRREATALQVCVTD